MKKLIDFNSIPGLIVLAYGSDCWTDKGKPILFKVRRRRKPGHMDGWICVQIVMFFIFNLNIAWKGSIT